MSRAARGTAERFWEKVDQRGPDECWEWSAGRFDKGYGQFRPGPDAPGETRAHRVAWVLTHGTIPEGRQALHRCDNPPCCNPGHLFLGTAADNSADMLAKGRERILFGDDHGSSKLTSEQVVAIRRIYAAGGVTQRQLAVRFGTNQSTVSDVVTGSAWRQSIALLEGVAA